MRKIYLIILLFLPFVSNSQFVAGFKVNRVPAPSARYYQFYDATSVGVMLGGIGDFVEGDLSVSYGWGKRLNYSLFLNEREGNYRVFDVTGSVVIDLLYMDELIILGPKLGLSGRIYTLSPGSFFQVGNDERTRAVVFGADTGLGIGVNLNDSFGILLSASYLFNIPTRVKEQVSYTEEVYDEETGDYDEEEVWETVSAKDKFFSSGFGGELRLFWIIDE